MLLFAVGDAGRQGIKKIEGLFSCSSSCCCSAAAAAADDEDEDDDDDEDEDEDYNDEDEDEDYNEDDEDDNDDDVCRCGIRFVLPKLTHIRDSNNTHPKTSPNSARSLFNTGINPS